jgi:16S rRNA (guanine527-N7)-methyltransferase
MRKPADQPLVTGKTETPPERHLLLSTPRDDAAEARLAFEGLLADAPDLADGLPDGFGDAVQQFVVLLLEANLRLNLTRVTLPAEVARLHLLDSLAALPFLDRFAPDWAIDLGSGGGLPAVPLAMARPGIAWTLVDSVGKKAAALQGIVEELGLRNVTVLAERAETLGQEPGHRERYGLVTARACAALPVLVELGLPLLAHGGQLLAWKGPLARGDDEIRRGRAAASALGGGALRIEETGLPALGGHRFVTVIKERATPARYPRRPGEPGRRPLG